MASGQWFWNSSIFKIELSSSFSTSEALFCLLFYFSPSPQIRQRGADFIMDGRRSFTSTKKRRKENGRDRRVIFWWASREVIFSKIYQRRRIMHSNAWSNIHALAQHVSSDFCARVEDDEKGPKGSEKGHFLYCKSDNDRSVIFKKFEAITKTKFLWTFLYVKPPIYEPWYISSKRVFQYISQKLKCLRMLSLHEYNITYVSKLIRN